MPYPRRITIADPVPGIAQPRLADTSAFLTWRLRARESLGLAATLAAAAIFVGGTVATYLIFESSSSSMAGLIFIYSPLYQMTAIFIVFGIEITVRAWHRRRRAI